MKIKKSELTQLIREALGESLGSGGNFQAQYEAYEHLRETLWPTLNYVHDIMKELQVFYDNPQGVYDHKHMASLFFKLKAEMFTLAMGSAQADEELRKVT